MSNTKFFSNGFLKKVVFIFAMFVAFNSSKIEFSNVSFGQEQSATVDTVKINETQKQLFGEAKKAAGQDKNTRNSLIMIAAVLCVVGIAMYLAFKSDDGEKKQTFARTPKKEF